MENKQWYPPRSPFGLIQEDLFPNRWHILVACLMLNCTSRKQVEKVIRPFIDRGPPPEALLAADPDDIKRLISPLGFGVRRTANLLKLAEAYLSSNWMDARQLPGVGEYAGRSYDIFCRGVIGSERPNDHALVDYWEWLKKQHPDLLDDIA
jgi:methyl-CpG-binding domain protein 4